MKTEIESEDINYSELKTKILLFIRNKDETYLSDLINNFKVEPSTIIKVLEEMKKKRMVRRVE